MRWETVVKRPSLNLGLRSRAVFAGAYLLAQAGLIATAFLRPDKVFAFQMFNESSTIAIALSRRVEKPDGTVVTMPTNGVWWARDRAGAEHPHDWAARVRDSNLVTLGRPVHASYGADAQLFRLQRALDDVMAHSTDDVETRALVADVEVRRNGKSPVHVRLVSAK
jgi:hypothetical protein